MAHAPSIALFFCIATSAGAVSLRAEAGQDLVSTKIQQQDDACACLPWQSVYSQHNTRCGDGHELATFTGLFVGGDVRTEWCTNFFEKAAFNYCLNEQFGYNPKQWCYVSSRCASATNKTKTGQGDVAMKWCNASAGDDLMSSRTPEELNRIADMWNLDTGLFAKMSFRMSDFTWSQVEGASGMPNDINAVPYRQFHWILTEYGETYPGPQVASAAAEKNFHEVLASGIPTIFDEDNHHGPGTVVMGNKIYASLPVYGKDNPGRVYYTCQTGCGSGSRTGFQEVTAY